MKQQAILIQCSTMQRIGGAVVRAGMLSSSPCEVTRASGTPCIHGFGGVVWALSTAFATSATYRKRAFSSDATNSLPSRAASMQSSGADEACAALYFTGTPPATDILGHFSVREISGKGRGLLAQRELHPGDLVMAVHPVAVLHGPQDAMPSPDALVEHLEASWPAMAAEQRAALRQMFVGPTANGTSTAQQADGSQPTLPPVTDLTGSGDAEGVDFRAIVSYNAYGDEYEDLPAAELRGCDAGPQSHVGVWAHFSNLNHACAPNCVHYVVGSTMIVRAVQVVSEGSELLVSYLGRDDLAPRQVRQAALQARYGFKCDCARCRTEAELPEELQALLQQLYDRTRHEFAPRFERLAAAAASAAEGLDAGGGVSYDDGDDVEDVDQGNDVDIGTAVAAGAAAASSLTAASAVRVAGSGLTSAALAKRALRKSQQKLLQQQQQQQEQGGSDDVEGPAAARTQPALSQGPGALLASLQPHLEECARQLHLAIQELQEDDEAAEDPGVATGATGVASAPTTTAAGRQLTRVQAAQAAAYQVLELLHLHAELTAVSAAGGGGGLVGATGSRSAAAASGALQACWHVLDAISRGSELQVFQAGKLLDDALKAAGYRARSGGMGGGRDGKTAAAAAPADVREAAALLGQSLLARYGRLRGEALTRMTQAAIRASRGFF